MELGNNLRNLRKQRGLRQEQLAEAVGVSVAAVSKWETAQCAPELTVLMELADFFEVSVDTLLGHTLHEDRLEGLIAQMDEALSAREEETTASVCDKILRNYPNNSRAIEACSRGYYQLFAYTSKDTYMEQSITQTKRLMTLKQGEPERNRLTRLNYLGNQYELLHQWNIAKDYYEQSNVDGSSDACIARCLFQQGQTQKALEMLSQIVVTSVFHQYGDICTLVDAWVLLGEYEKACAALAWMYDVMEGLHYNPTMMLLIQTQLAGLYRECGQMEAAQAAIRKAAELAKENSKQEIEASAEFLQLDRARELILSAPDSNRELLLQVVTKMGAPFTDIVEEVLP